MFGSSPLAWGIHLAAATKEAVTNGSSPLAWGIRNSPASHTALLFGSSPLAWGIRRCTTGACPGKSVHPHSRGVYFIAFSLSIPPTGSSPLAWGILYGHDKDKSLRRFIPTRVGYTMPFLVIAYSNTVHPHSRGVYTKKIVDFTGFL